MKTIKVMQVGLGPIGQKAVQFLSEKKHLQLVAAVDSAADKAGRLVKEICALDSDPGVTVVSDVAAACEKTQPDVARVTTISSFLDCAPQLEKIAKLKIHVVSTCAVAVNTISSIVKATPGLHVMTDLPTVSCFDVDK